MEALNGPPVFRVSLQLRSPDNDAEVVRWRIDLGARRRWRLPVAVLLGQRGWFDIFPTRIDATTSTVQLPADAVHRVGGQLDGRCGCVDPGRAGVEPTALAEQHRDGQTPSTARPEIEAPPHYLSIVVG